MQKHNQSCTKKSVPTTVRIIAAAITAVAVLALAVHLSNKIDTDKDVSLYLQKRGFTVISNAEVTYITIPSEWTGVYENYNILQKKNGYDLTRYKGKSAKRYTFAVTALNGGDETAYANVLVYGGKVIGGDVCTYALDGYMTGLNGKY